MPDPTSPAATQMIGGATPQPQGVQPYFVQPEQTQSHPVMDFFQNWATNKLGLAGQEMNQREAMKRQEAEAMSNMLVHNPTLAANQGFMKSLSKLTDPNFANSLGAFAHVHSLKQATDAAEFAKATGLGGGGAAVSGSAGGGPDYTDLPSAKAHMQKLEQFQAFHGDMDENTRKLLEDQKKQTENDIKFYETQLGKQTPSAYQEQELGIRKQELGLATKRESREETESASRIEDRKFRQNLASARQNLSGGKGITPDKLAAQRQKFDQQFAQYRASDPERAVAIDDAWNGYLDRLKESGTDSKMLEPFYTAGATTESAGGISGMLGSKKAVEKSAAETPPSGAVAAIKDASGKVTGYRMKDGSIQRLATR